MDNFCVFWEATAVAVKSKQNLVVVLLDFEKTYDRVYWNFLEAIIHDMSFNTTWIKGVSSLYKKCTQAGGVGPQFKITRSIRQGCLLAPFFFPFVCGSNACIYIIAIYGLAWFGDANAWTRYIGLGICR